MPDVDAIASDNNHERLGIHGTQNPKVQPLPTDWLRLSCGSRRPAHWFRKNLRASLNLLEVRGSFPHSMSDPMQQIIQSKDAERRRLRELPWLEKLDMLTKLRQRHACLQTLRKPAARASA